MTQKFKVTKLMPSIANVMVEGKQERVHSYNVLLEKQESGIVLNNMIISVSLASEQGGLIKIGDEFELKKV